MRSRIDQRRWRTRLLATRCQERTKTSWYIQWLTYHLGIFVHFWRCRWLLNLVSPLWHFHCYLHPTHLLPPPAQHYLTAFGAMIAIPLLLSEGLCLRHDGLTQSRLINTGFFVGGLCTVLQVTFGVRLGCCCALITIKTLDSISFKIYINGS